jgi:glycosyltransferase involved in cell wall biosynthesis
MPAFNAARFIDEALAAVQRQSLTRWECVVVNDGSTDETAEIVQRYVAVDHRFRLVSQQNRGMCAASNAGYELTSRAAPFVLFTDSDDIAHPEMLQRLASYLVDRPTCGLVCCDYDLIDSQGKKRPHGPRERFEWSFGLPRRAAWRKEVIPFETIYAWGPPGEPWSMMRKSAFNAAGRWPENMGNGRSVVVFGQIALRSEVCFYPETLYEYRRYDGQVSSTMGSHLTEIEAQIDASYRDLVQRHPEHRGTVMSGYRLRTAVRTLPCVRMAFGALRRGYLREASRLAMRLRPFGSEFHGV